MLSKTPLHNPKATTTKGVMLFCVRPGYINLLQIGPYVATAASQPASQWSAPRRVMQPTGTARGYATPVAHVAACRPKLQNFIVKPEPDRRTFHAQDGGNP